MGNLVARVIVNVWGVGYRLVDAPLVQVPTRRAPRLAGLDIAS